MKVVDKAVATYFEINTHTRYMTLYLYTACMNFLSYSAVEEQIDSTDPNCWSRILWQFDYSQSSLFLPIDEIPSTFIDCVNTWVLHIWFSCARLTAIYFDYSKRHLTNLVSIFTNNNQVLAFRLFPVSSSSLPLHQYCVCFYRSFIQCFLILSRSHTTFRYVRTLHFLCTFPLSFINIFPFFVISQTAKFYISFLQFFLILIVHFEL